MYLICLLSNAYTTLQSCLLSEASNLNSAAHLTRRGLIPLIAWMFLECLNLWKTSKPWLQSYSLHKFKWIRQFCICFVGRINKYLWVTKWLNAARLVIRLDVDGISGRFRLYLSQSLRINGSWKKQKKGLQQSQYKDWDWTWCWPAGAQ